MGSHRWIQLISRIHLTPGGGKSIQLVKSRQAIRIVAPKVVAEACLNALNDTFQKIKSKAITKDMVHMQYIRAWMLEELGRITNSVVEMDEIRKEVSDEERSHC